MKKKYLFGMALMASLAFFSCTNEVVYVHDGESSEQVSDEQIITLQVSNGGDGLTTRGGRPLYSSETKQTIENVRLWIFDNEGTLKYSTTLENWNSTGSTEYGESNEHGREAKIKLPGDNKLETGAEYTVYAIGYHSDGAYSGSIPAISGIQETAVENLQLSYSVTTNDCAEEIFAGSLTFTPDKDAFNKTIVLNRQVAGVFLYLNDIPFIEGMDTWENAKLDLVASSKNTTLVLGNFANKDFSSNGENSDATYVVNGTGTTTGNNTIVSINLKEWFKSLKDENNDGLIDLYATDEQQNTYGNWQRSNTFQQAAATFEKGSVFGSSFIIPFAHVDATQTLTLKLTNGSDVKRTWNINLPSSDSQVGENITVWDGTSQWDAATITDPSSSVYSILRNHLYGVGDRISDYVPGTEPGGENPEIDPDPDPDPDPDTDGDDPESLNNKQELTLRVNDNWEIIHGMELE